MFDSPDPISGLGGKLVTRVVVRGGCGKAAIDTDLRGSGSVLAGLTGDDCVGVAERCTMDGGLTKPEAARGVWGSCDILLRLCSDGRAAMDDGRAGRAVVGGEEALNERWERGVVAVVVAVAMMAAVPAVVVRSSSLLLSRLRSRS